MKKCLWMVALNVAMAGVNVAAWVAWGSTINLAATAFNVFCAGVCGYCAWKCYGYERCVP